MKSILTAIVCIDRDADLCEQLHQALLNNESKDIIIVTRETDTKIINFWKTKCKVLKTIPHYEITERHNMTKIAEKRMIVIKYAKKNKYKSVWFVDSDIIPTRGILEKLKKTKMDICIAPYRVKWQNVPCVGITDDKPPFIKIHAITEEDKTTERKTCVIGGFGCTLINKPAYKQQIERGEIVHPTTGEIIYGEDIGFFLGCMNRGLRCEYLTNCEQPHYYDRFG